MGEQLVYWMYVATGLGAIAVYAGLPKKGATPRHALFGLLLVFALGGLALLLNRLLGEAGDPIVFGFLAILALGGAIRVLTHPRPVYSALYFILVILSTAALIIHVGAEFLGVALVIVYAGAILVTYVFVIMLSQQSESVWRRHPTGEEHGLITRATSSILDYDRSAREPFWATAAGFLLTAVIGAVIVRHQAAAPVGDAVVAVDESNTLRLGTMLMTDFAISVEVAGVLLMVAMIGAIAVARKRIPHVDEGVDAPPPGEIGKRVEPF